MDIPGLADRREERLSKIRQLVPGLRSTSLKRQSQLQECLVRDGASAAIFFSPEDIYLLSGFQTPGHYYPQAVVVPVGGDPFIVCREFERGNMREAWVETSFGYFDDEAFHQKLAHACSERDVGGNVQVQADAWFVTPARFSLVVAALEDMGSAPRSATHLIDDIRLVKSEAEIEAIREAARIASRSMEAAIREVRLGVSDLEIAAGIYESMIMQGGEYPSLPPFVEFGEGLPHVTWGGREATEGMCITVEIGAVFLRYSGALTRTVTIGEPDAETRAAMTVVEAGLVAAVEHLVPGMTGEEVCAACRGPLEQAGLGDFMKNRAGYSIGVNFPPDWGEGDLFSLRYGERRRLVEGMVFHIVPSVLRPSVGEVGTSATVVVRPGRGEILSSTSIPPLTAV